MGLVLVICIIIIFVLYNKKSNLENENKRLKKELREHKAIIEALEKRFNVHASISSNRNTSTTATTNANVYKMMKQHKKQIQFLNLKFLKLQKKILKLKPRD